MLDTHKKITLELSPRQLQLILESILFTISPEINHSLYKKEILELMELAIKFRKSYQDIPTSNINLNSGPVSSELSAFLLSYFPELTTN